MLTVCFRPSQAGLVSGIEIMGLVTSCPDICLGAFGFHPSLVCSG